EGGRVGGWGWGGGGVRGWGPPPLFADPRGAGAPVTSPGSGARPTERAGAVAGACRLGAGTRCGAFSISRCSVSPFSRRVGVRSLGARVATTCRFSTAPGGLAPAPEPDMTLAATGLTSGAPCNGWSFCTSCRSTRSTWTRPWPKRSDATPTTAWFTCTFRYTLMFVTFTVVLRLMTVLLTTRGPAQPLHDGTPTKPWRPHHGITGSPQDSGAQYRGCVPIPTVTPPRKTTSAGA